MPQVRAESPNLHEVQMNETRTKFCKYCWTGSKQERIEDGIWRCLNCGRQIGRRKPQSDPVCRTAPCIWRKGSYGKTVKQHRWNGTNRCQWCKKTKKEVKL